MRFLSPSREDGSLPIALLAAIVVAGIAVVLTARAVTGERAVRFDRSFTETFHVADAGVEQAVFQLNAGLFQDSSGPDCTSATPTPTPCFLNVGDSTSPMTATFGDDTYTWTLTRDGARSWTVVSSGTQGDVSRTVQADITEKPLFFPGAFGDTLIAVNGTSTSVDSYNSSDTCTGPASECEWGTDDSFGTGNGSIGTNGDFDFSGNPVLRPGSAFLYDWADNRPPDVTASDPFGSRCAGNPCTETYVSKIDEPLDFSSEENMRFISQALDDCDGVDQELGDARFGRNGGGNNTTVTLSPYVEDSSWTVTDPKDPNFVNYYCADSLQFLDDVELVNAGPDTPVVIFVRDFVTIDNQIVVACEDGSGSECSQNKTSVPELRASDTRPPASQFQIYVEADERSGGERGSNITYKANSVFAGVMYAPRSRCGSPGGATVDIFGAIICGSMDNVGAWNFHYDDALGQFGTGVYGVGYYTEQPPATP